MLRPKELVAKMKAEAEALMGTLKPAVKALYQFEMFFDDNKEMVINRHK